MTAELPTQLYRAEQVRELDRRAIEDHGCDAYGLMRRAATAAFALLRERWPEARKLYVFCGAGNNGGDGLVLAQLARQAGLDETVILLADAQQLRGSAAQALADYLAEGARPVTLGDLDERRMAQEMVQNADVIVDGLLGTGLSRPVAGDYLKAIEVLRSCHKQGTAVMALDIPSGLNADTGAVMGAAVKADCTLSFIGFKLGLLTGEGPELCGQTHFDNLAVPAEVFAGLAPAARRIDETLRQRLLPPRSRIAHKGANGRVLCIGGDHGTSGAIRIAAEAALRSGAGLVSVATQPDVAAAMSQARPELMAMGVADAKALPGMLKLADVIVLGPGLGQRDWGWDLWAAALESDKPLIIDADALNLLAEQPRRNDRWILTPHPGEAARLLNCTTAEIQADRPVAARSLCERYGGIVVLKGAGTLIQTPDDGQYLCAAGNPGMAVGGMGDLLTGIIAGLQAQGLNGQDAATLGVYLHARAADEAVREGGERGLLPSDLWPQLRRLVNP